MFALLLSISFSDGNILAYSDPVFLCGADTLARSWPRGFLDKKPWRVLFQPSGKGLEKIFRREKMEELYMKGKKGKRFGITPPFSRFQNNQRPTLGLPEPNRSPHRRESGVWGLPNGFTSFVGKTIQFSSILSSIFVKINRIF